MTYNIQKLTGKNSRWDGT